MTELPTRRVRILLALCLIAAAGLSQGCKKKSAPPGTPGDSTSSAAPGSAQDAALAKKADAAFEAIEQAWAKTSSFSAKVDTFIAEAIGREGKTTGTGTYDLLKDGDKTKIRFYAENILYIAMPEKPGSELRTAEFLYWVTDGVVLYQSTHQYKKYEVTKSWYHEKDVLQVAGPWVVNILRNERKVTSIDEATLEGRDFYVIEAVPIDGAWSERHYFDKQTGIRFKYVEFDADHEKFFQVTLSDVETGVEFEPDHFTLEVPEEATFIDKTKE